MVRLFLTVILLILLTGCGVNVYPPGGQLIKKAIAVELEQTKQLLSQQLDVNFQDFEIKRVFVKKQDPIYIQKLPSYHIQGTYDLTFNLPERQLKKEKKEFDLYLQVQKEGKTWRLLLPDNSSNDEKAIWRSYLVQ
ncbi:MAG: hypothetical protein KME64_45000 [Scytonematopsis contorta HA4267-MV1]|jgi:hypothetical protein|nr:hypothetical protein [Scytonematopsis contorta HA4267-MV1]